MKDLRQQAKNKPKLYLPASSSPAETFAYGTLGLVGIASILLALVSASMPPGCRRDPITDAATYVRSGQVIADLRSATALVNYLLEIGTSGPTNIGAPGSARKSPVIPPNNASNEPSA